MFRDRIRALIDRHCLLLRGEAGELGRMLARCDPYAGEVEPSEMASARRACRSVLDRCEALGVDRIEDSARSLDATLAALEARERIEPWDMVEVMALQAELVAAVDELEAERSGLYIRCTEPAALEVAPMLPSTFG